MGQAAYVPECLDCGACCFSNLATYVRVGGDDYQRLGEKASDLTEFHGNRCYMRRSMGTARPSLSIAQRGASYVESTQIGLPLVAISRGDPRLAKGRFIPRGKDPRWPYAPYFDVRPTVRPRARSHCVAS